MNQRYYWRVFSSSPLSRFRASTSVVSVCIPAAEERYFSINATTAAGVAPCCARAIAKGTAPHEHKGVTRPTHAATTHKRNKSQTVGCTLCNVSTRRTALLGSRTSCISTVTTNPSNNHGQAPIASSATLAESPIHDAVAAWWW